MVPSIETFEGAKALKVSLRDIMSDVATEFEMKKITAEFLKKNCAAVLREVQTKRKTSSSRRMASPWQSSCPVDKVDDSIFGFLKGRAMIVGDVVSPALTLEEWGDLA
jgi:hypothetical protein